METMRNEIEKFITFAERCDQTVVNQYTEATVSHTFFGEGTLCRIDIRPLPDGPIFRIRFGEDMKEFNLESFREGFFTNIAAQKKAVDVATDGEKSFALHATPNVY